MSRFLIIGDGTFVPATLLREASNNATIIALDGAAQTLEQMHQLPHIVLGDMDSLSQPDIWANQHPTVTMINAPSPDQTDLMKSIEYADQQGATQIDLICVTGTRWDHTLNNVRALKRYYQPHRPIRLITDEQTLTYCEDATTWIHGQPGQACGIMAYPNARIDTQGLVWDVTDYPLVFAQSESVCNRLKSTKAQIQVYGQALIIAPGHLLAQSPPKPNSAKRSAK